MAGGLLMLLDDDDGRWSLLVFRRLNSMFSEVRRIFPQERLPGLESLGQGSF
jgi:hypothetical protein